MDNEILNVTLSFPCRADWDKFEIVQGGRLCSRCHHIVRDFRDCSMAELKEAFKNGRSVCGLFRKNQLSPAFLKAAAITLSLATLSSCDPEIPILPQSVNSQSPNTEELMGKVGNIDDDGWMGAIIENETDSVRVIELAIPPTALPNENRCK